MSNAEQLTKGNFGLGQAVRIAVDRKAPHDQLHSGASLLIKNALEVFDLISGNCPDLPEGFFAGLYLLRQGVVALDVCEDLPLSEASKTGATP